MRAIFISVCYLPTTRLQPLPFDFRKCLLPFVQFGDNQTGGNTLNGKSTIMPLTSFASFFFFWRDARMSTQCIKSNPWIHCRTRSQARSRLMLGVRLWPLSSRAAMPLLLCVRQLFIGSILRGLASPQSNEM